MIRLWKFCALAEDNFGFFLRCTFCCSCKIFNNSGFRYCYGCARRCCIHILGTGFEAVYWCLTKLVSVYSCIFLQQHPESRVALSISIFSTPRDTCCVYFFNYSLYRTYHSFQLLMLLLFTLYISITSISCFSIIFSCK